MNLHFTAERIRKMRERLGLSQRGFAQKLGVTQPAVAQWELGQRTPSGPAVLEALLALEKSLPEAQEAPA